jgi:hypothetical protein
VDERNLRALGDFGPKRLKMCQKRVIQVSSGEIEEVQKERKRARFTGAFLDGASRTRTGDLLGAISAKAFAVGCRGLSYALSMRLRGVGALRLFAGLRRGYLTKT